MHEDVQQGDEEEEVTVHEILAVLLLSMITVMSMGMFYAGLALLLLALMKRIYRFEYYQTPKPTPSDATDTTTSTLPHSQQHLVEATS